MLGKEKSVKVITFYWKKILTFAKKNKAFGAPLSLTSLYQQRKAQRLTDLAWEADCSPIDSKEMKWHQVFNDCPQLAYAKQELITSIEKAHLWLLFQDLTYTECFSGVINESPVDLETYFSLNIF